MTTDFKPRLGKKNMTAGSEKYGETEYRPTQTISGRPLDAGVPYSTMGIGSEGHFVVLDMKISDEKRDALVVELLGYIKKDSKSTSSKVASE